MALAVTIKTTIQQTSSILSCTSLPPSSQSKITTLTTLVIVTSNLHLREIDGMRRRPRGRGDSSHRLRPSFRRWRRNRGNSSPYKLKPCDLYLQIKGTSAITLYPRPGLKFQTTLIAQQIMHVLWVMVESLLSPNIETAGVAQ